MTKEKTSDKASGLELAHLHNIYMDVDMENQVRRPLILPGHGISSFVPPARILRDAFGVLACIIAHSINYS
jgi:hypothetical protein